MAQDSKNLEIGERDDHEDGRLDEPKERRVNPRMFMQPDYTGSRIAPSAARVAVS
jgi:hypothetical protein